MIMDVDCRKFIDSLYPKNREWKNNEIVDVMIYYNEYRYLVKYNDDIVYIFDSKGNFIRSFDDYEEFVIHIGGMVDVCDIEGKYK